MDDKKMMLKIYQSKRRRLSMLPQITAVLYCSLVSALFWREYFYRRITG